MRRLLTVLLVTTLCLVGCAPDGDDGDSTPTSTAQPPADLPAADDAVTALVAALNEHDVSELSTVNAASDAQADFTTIFAGMDEIYPSVTAGAITYDGADGASATLNMDYPLGLNGWSYTSTASFRYVTDTWRLDWQPSIIHPDLTSASRMRHTQTAAKRGAINDRDGNAIVEERSLYEIGLDKSKVEEAEWETAAGDLADLLDIDRKSYVEKVLANGPKAYVVGAKVRQSAIPTNISDVPGAMVREVRAVLGPSDSFAVPILGAVGAPSAEQIEESAGTLTSADIVGTSGLQARYDETLRGVPLVKVDLVARKVAEGETAEPVEEKTLFQQDASVSSSISISLDRNLQTKAEKVLKSQKGTAALVVIDLHDGGVLAAAQSEAAGTYPYVTYGKYAPGSTFKVATSLAMLRKGKEPSSTVNCPNSLKVNTYTFGNYSGYPSSATGKVPMETAFKYSCNTAFAGANVSAKQLHAAAASLGVGVDYDAGFTAYFGTVDPGNKIDLAASKIGQGQVTMSPLGMAAVAASVGSGQTTIPWLVEGEAAKSTAAPLSSTETKQLRQLMKATVDSGTATKLQGIMTGAKSGTAQWGKTGDLKTSAWMIAYNDDVAVASFVEVGDSGGTTAAPLIVKLFS